MADKHRFVYEFDDLGPDRLAYTTSEPPSSGASCSKPLRTFEVVKPFEVDVGTVAPAFDQIGLGTQYKAPVDMGVLLKRGIIREITP